MVCVEGEDLVVLATHQITVRQLGYFYRESGTIATKLLRAVYDARGGTRAPESQRFRSSLQRHGAHETNNAKNMIGVQVCEKNILQREGDSVAHHLSLGTFAAIEEERLTFAHERDSRDVSFHSWS
jgi:hypothetical protein